MVYRAATLSIALAIFNLLPIPPLDGSKVLFSLLPEHIYFKLMRYERYGMIILILLVVQGTIFTATVGEVTKTVHNLFLGIAEAAYNFIR